MVSKNRFAARAGALAAALLLTGAAGCSTSGHKQYQGLAPNNPSHMTFKQFSALSPQQKQQYLQQLRQHEHASAAKS